jgi:predicted amidohydrolase
VEHVNRAYASLFTAFVAHSNRVGFEDGLHFWAAPPIFDPNGELSRPGAHTSRGPGGERT